MATKSKKETKLSRCMKEPIRILSRARDLYIRSLSQCAGNFGNGAGGFSGGPAPQFTTLPKSFSVGSSRASDNDEDFRELVKIASTRSLGNKVQAELLRRNSPARGVNAVPRSQSVGIGRIDEDKACEFGGDVKVRPEVYPRSRSYAVSNRSTGLL